ncbi:unnamed protein product [Dovyalis caffra]|uniref:Uncharacterized protein n=1 Tax=Dovyalis caffra TaxID=77055 RepID=A0AAV1RR68_9ROSI|nr:unnamed protein product [Dovyalis caffra]
MEKEVRMDNKDMKTSITSIVARMSVRKPTPLEFIIRAIFNRFATKHTTSKLDEMLNGSEVEIHPNLSLLQECVMSKIIDPLHRLLSSKKDDDILGGRLEGDPSSK